MYDLVIVGMGISGCYLANRINRKHPNWKILCLERYRSYGGRIVSVPDGNVIIELGAFRYSPSFHLEVQALVDEYQVPVTELITKQKCSCSDKKVDKILAETDVDYSYSIRTGLVQYLYDKGASCKNIDKFVTCSGYNTLGADISLEWALYDLSVKGPYNRFPTGYRTICTKLLDQLDDNVIIRYNSEVKSIDQENNLIYLDGETIPYRNNNLIITVQPQILPYILGPNYNITGSMIPYTALRLYIQLDYCRPLKQGLYITCLPIRKLFILPNNMALVYTDGPDAKITESLVNNQPKLIVRWIRKLLCKKVKAVSYKYKLWNDGINFWRPLPNRPSVTGKFYYVNGDVSPEPGWVNGALKLCNSTLRYL